MVSVNPRNCTMVRLLTPVSSMDLAESDVSNHERRKMELIMVGFVVRAIPSN